MANTRIYWIHTLSPTHAGVGRGLDYIDLPIDRDAVTSWPLIRASGFKGVWADHFRATDEARKGNNELRAAFGVSSDDDNSNSGSLVPSDAQLVCLPIRSFYGTFAWCTSPLALRVLQRTLTLAGLQDAPAAPESRAGASASLASNSVLRGNGHIYLEDLDLPAAPDNAADAWAGKIAGWVFADDAAWQAEFKRRFAIVPDDIFTYLCQTGTEVCTRVRISDDTKTVDKGALWTEESLPSETILAGVVKCERVFGLRGEKNGRAEEISPEILLDKFAKGSLHLQIGGKATVGRGQVRCIFTPVNGGAQ
jgi:CRISPR-associated protein Cmr4